MKTIHAFATAAVMGLLALSALPAAAQSPHGHDQAGMAMPSMPQHASGEGEVRKIDARNRKVTLSHQASKDLGMPAMTMVYGVSDAAMLSKVKVGDRVRFSAATAGGTMTITEMQAAR